MSNNFTGAALYSAYEIKLAIDNYKTTKKFVNNLIKSKKDALKDKAVKRCWLFEDTNWLFTWSEYFYEKEMISLEEKDAGVLVNDYDDNGVYYDVIKLSDGGKKDCYLNPIQAGFVNSFKEYCYD